MLFGRDQLTFLRAQRNAENGVGLDKQKRAGARIQYRPSNCNPTPNVFTGDDIVQQWSPPQAALSKKKN